MANGQLPPSQILSVSKLQKSFRLILDFVFNTSLITAPRLYDYNCSRSTFIFFTFLYKIENIVQSPMRP